MTTTIRQDDIIASVADALQYISIYHPLDFIQAVNAAYEREASEAARDALAQILINSRMCAEGRRPICQDTGIVTVFCSVGQDVHIEGDMGLSEMINTGVSQAYLNPDNPLRGSVLADPDGARRNTKDNTPAVIHYDIVPGNTIDIHVAAKGGGSEAKSKFAMLNPSDSIVDWVLKQIPTMGAGWCPPGVLGLGIGGTAEKAMVLAKESLLAPLDINELAARGARTRAEELRLELFTKINELGIGAQGVGGLTTVLDVKVLDTPTHAANKPIAMIPNCAATRHAHFTLRGDGPALQKPPKLEDWPVVARESGGNAIRLDLNRVTKDDLQTLKPGDTVLLSGKLLTGRDAAHKRLVDMIARGEDLPVDFTNRFIYYVGPVDAVRDEAVGPAGPTTSTRMDKFTRTMLEQTGLIGMVGKAERGVLALEAIADNKAVYLMAVGGAAYLVSKAIKSAKVLAFEDLGMEAIYEFDVEDMPVTVAVDSHGESVHNSGPATWRAKIASGEVSVVTFM